MKINQQYIFISILFALLSNAVWAQVNIRGKVINSTINKGIEGVEVTLDPLAKVVMTNQNGEFHFENVGQGNYQIWAKSSQFEPVSQLIVVGAEGLEVELRIDSVYYELEDVKIRDAYAAAAWMRSVEGMAIYAAKKTELIRLDNLTANLATNNARQAFARIAGLNIWESDGGGLQLGIGGRGLNPNRTSNFNTRQNGYDIAADALGYPESYYTPPMEALERIEVVRGAASLQYGTQFGGMLNFVFREGNREKPLEFVSRHTLGSYGLYNTFNSVGGTIGKVNYYGFYQFKRGNGWRPNAGFMQHTAYGAVNAALNARFSMGLEYTRMDYLAQQPGGLTDALFGRDPRQSIRERNWFKVGWNLLALTADLALGDRTRLNTRNFGLFASRNALGFPGAINRVDPGKERDLLSGRFQNFGNETRILHKFLVLGRPAVFLLGGRYYQGKTRSQQGFADSGQGPNFQFLHPALPKRSNYVFPSRNVAFFAEQLINLKPRLSFTPGVRFEYIKTASKGSYFERAYDLAGNLILEEEIQDGRRLDRNLILAGIGLAYVLKDDLELYANFSQNYRAVNFNDLRVVNPNYRVDETLHDERGFNLDLGLRGQANNWLSFDLSAFFLNYRDRIGQVLRTDIVTFQYYRFRTNIANSRNIGLEMYAEADLFNLFNTKTARNNLVFFTNFALIDSRYLDSEEPAFDGKQVEMSPPLTLKTGINLGRDDFKLSLQWAFTSAHFTDATNAISTPNSVEGIIPSYQVMDLSMSYHWRFLQMEAGCNNLLNTRYYTRRATAYPGPGIVPAAGRSIYFTIQVKI